MPLSKKDAAIWLFECAEVPTWGLRATANRARTGQNRAKRSLSAIEYKVRYMGLKGHGLKLIPLCERARAAALLVF